MKRLPLLLSLLATIGILAATSTTALAVVTNHWKTTTVAPPVFPNDLHILYTWTGGTIGNIQVAPAPATTGTSAGGAQIDITWAAPLAPGTQVDIKFTTDTGGVLVNSGTWTVNGNNVGNVTPANADNEGDAQGVPAASPLVILFAALAVAAAGGYALSRRSAAA